MFVIGYGLDTGNSFGIGRIGAEEGWKYVTEMAENGSDLEERIVMSILINFRINIMAWYAILFTSVFGLLVEYDQRATVHLLGFLANAGTCLLHLYHIGVFGSRTDANLVPPNDPYHRIPVPFDFTVSLLNLIAFLQIVLPSTRREKIANQERPKMA